MKREIVIGTRGSRLARRQTDLVLSDLRERYYDRKFSVKHIKTYGDKITDVPLAKIGDKGLFIKELETALFDGRVDICVHSMKDLPTGLPEGLKIGAICKRLDSRDALVSPKGYVMDELPNGAKVGTSSLRRRAQLLNRRPDLNVVDLRGNLNTRLEKMNREGFDAIILASAGIRRLGLEEIITEYISPETMLPAVGQGAVGIEIREDDGEVEELVKDLSCRDTYHAITAERAFMSHLEGGCQIPVGALAEVDGESLIIKGMVAGLEGEVLLKDEIKGSVYEAYDLGIKLAEKLLDRGAGAILAGIRREMDSRE